MGRRKVVQGAVSDAAVSTASSAAASSPGAAIATSPPGRLRRAAAIASRARTASALTPEQDPSTIHSSLPQQKRHQTQDSVSSSTALSSKLDGSHESSPSLSPLTTPSPPLPPTKRPRKRKPQEPITYVIPPVERLETSFRGRLGYACLNTILRVQKPEPIFCSRTCRIDTIKKEGGWEQLKELGRKNMADLTPLIEWNAKHHIYFMRMSSEMFPFAAHNEYGYSLEYAQKELTLAGDTAKRLGVRLTTHPGQFTQLGSPREIVVQNAVKDLCYHNEMMDRMGLDIDSVMIIHGGGIYGDKAAALERFKINYKTLLPQGVKNRLVLENDEICFSVEDLLPVCEELNIPIVLDYHHDWILPSSQTVEELMPRILATWTRKGIKPKQHLSEPRRGAVTVMERRAHADRCQRLPLALPNDMDLMIEAKDKEQAVMHLYRIYGLQPTLYEDLRPPAELETTQTAGRKSTKSKVKKALEATEAAKKKMAEKGMAGEDQTEDVDGEEEGEMGGFDEEATEPVDFLHSVAAQSGIAPSAETMKEEIVDKPLSRKAAKKRRMPIDSTMLDDGSGLAGRETSKDKKKPRKSNAKVSKSQAHLDKRIEQAEQVTNRGKSARAPSNIQGDAMKNSSKTPKRNSRRSGGGGAKGLAALHSDQAEKTENLAHVLENMPTSSNS